MTLSMCLSTLHALHGATQSCLACEWSALALLDSTAATHMRDKSYSFPFLSSSPLTLPPKHSVCDPDLEVQIQAAREAREADAAAAAAAPEEGDVGFGASSGYNNGDLYGATTDYNASIGAGTTMDEDADNTAATRGTGSRRQ